MAKRIRHIGLAIWACAAVWGLEATGEAPIALVLSPVNATWAANHIAHWRDKGFGGFIFEGIADDRPVQGTDALAPLILEVRLAHERLAEAGLANNFLCAGLTPEDAYFASPDTARTAVDRMREAGALCAAIGLRGIALDSASSSGFYDYRWDGYDYQNYGPDDVLAGARRFGRQLTRAVLREAPGAAILVIADGWPGSGPLWLPFFEGLLDGASGDSACEVHLLTRQTFAARTAAEFTRIARQTRGFLEQRLAPRERGFWRRRGFLSVGLEPLVLDKVSGDCVACVGAAAFRGQVAAAKALSDRYIWIESTASCWWQLSEQEVATYSQLLQNGQAVPEQTRPVVANLDDYTARMPYDAWRRVGPYESLGRPCEVYAPDDGAALVFWAGTGGERVPVSGERTLSVENMATGVRSEHKPESGQVALPALDAPILVEGLSARPWILDAGLRLEVEQWPWASTASSGRPAVISFAFRNGSALTVGGSMELLGPPDYSINPSSLKFELATGGFMQGAATVRGKFKTGEGVQITAGLTVSGAGIVTRVVDLETCPETLWVVNLDGNVAGNIVVADIDGEGPLEVLACSDAGEAACFDSRGGLIWKRRFAAAFREMPAVGILASGDRATATVDIKGNVRLLDAAGAVAWEREAGTACLAPLFADVDEFGGEELAIPSADGRVALLDAGGQELWSQKPLAGMNWLLRVRNDHGKDSLLAAQAGPLGLVVCLGQGGRACWRSFAQGPLAAPPVLADVNADSTLDVVAVTVDGAVTAWDSATGAEILRQPTGRRDVVAVTLAGPRILLANTDGWHVYAPDLTPGWSYKGKPGAAPAGTDGFVVAPLESRDGTVEMVCLDHDGHKAWQTHDGASALGPAVVADLEGDGAFECIYGAWMGTVRAVRVN